MPPLSELPNDYKRDKFIGVLVSLGFEKNTRGGDGSHIKLTWPSTGKSLTVKYAKKLPKKVMNYLLKEVIEYSGLSWDQIKTEL